MYYTIPVILEMLMSSFAVLLKKALCFTLDERWLVTMLVHEH